MEIITLSTARNILIPGSRDRMRMARYAAHTNGFHIVVLTTRAHGYVDEVHEGPLHIYPTNSRTHVSMIIDAFHKALGVLRRIDQTAASLTAQDPLELGMLSYFLSLVSGVPYTIQVHGDYYSSRWPHGSLSRHIRRLMIPCVLRHACAVRVVSPRIKRSLLIHGVAENKISVLPIKPELDVFLRAVRTREADELFVVLTASRLAPEKNIPLLIEAFQKLHAECPQARLRIVGEGGERAHIEKLIIQYHLGSLVTLLPWTDQIEQEMVNADVFLLASEHEAYGLVLIESLACGTPVVTTDVGCAGDVVLDGVHGHVVAEHTAEALSHALHHLCTDNVFRKSAGEAGRVLGHREGKVTDDEYARTWVRIHSGR